MKQVLATGRKLLGPTRDYESRIDRETSPTRMLLVPIVSVMVGSMATAWLPLIAGTPNRFVFLSLGMQPSPKEKPHSPRSS